MLERRRERSRIEAYLSRFPVVAIVGARQIGKTTLARVIAARWRKGPVRRFDLEETSDRARLSDPMLALQDLTGLVILDEIQLLPEVFSTLRVLADRPRYPARFLILGSASPDLLRQSSESLAGRIIYHELKGFSMDEVGVRRRKKLWLRGGFPRSFLARTNELSFEWRRSFVRSFLERDLPQLGVQIPSGTLERFWSMVAHYHGQIWNSSEFARSFGVADTTIRRYLDVMTATYVVRQLRPFSENLAKRQVKSPKVYVSDSGLLHTLLNLRDQADVEGHPKVGASWEGFAINAVTRELDARPEECFFWATHSSAELDLLVVRGRHRWGFEFKRTVAPKITRSMRVAIEDLHLDRLDVIYAGDATYPLAERIRAVALSDLHRALGHGRAWQTRRKK
ncbi:MAG TPA: ATP-binding protein [Vicinamibacteria bacterium]|nr:ATP-binding protein [Vicinamibacteria bacterium]